MRFAQTSVSMINSATMGVGGAVSGRGLYKGHTLNAIDAKGRVVIPASLRQVVEQNGSARLLVIGKHDCDPCLIGYDSDWATHLHAQRTQRDSIQFEKNGAPTGSNPNRRAFGMTEDVPFDPSGRFVLPPFYKDRGKLNDLAFFLGTGDTFEIWNPLVLIETPGIDEEIKEIAAYEMKRRTAG
jgi:MraZ protein